LTGEASEAAGVAGLSFSWTPRKGLGCRGCLYEAGYTRGMTDTMGGGQGADLDGLLREVRHQTSGEATCNARRFLELLHRQTGVEAALVSAGGDRMEAATTAFPQQVLPALAPLFTRLSDGSLASAATEAEQLHVRCEALGPQEPRPVLVVADRAEPSPDTVALTAHTAGVLTLLLRAENGDRVLHSYQYKARQVRFAVLHALMAGGPLLARRMTAGAVPPLLEADRLRIHLLRCPPRDRDRISRLHQDPSGYHGSGLMVHCPVIKEHLICLIADGELPDGSAGSPHGLSDTLRRLVRDDPRCALGISGTHPLDATAAAYSEALHALAAARSAPDRVAHYHGRTPLAGILPRPAAHDWSDALLRPLESVPKVSADVTRLTLTLPRSGVARLLGLSRNTVAAHIGHAEKALGLDLTDVRTRAAVHLALAISGSPAGSPPVVRQPPPCLDELLRSEAAVAWARTVLRPLDIRHRRTLQAWIDANADASQAAGHLAISRNTVRAHLRTTESALGVDLLTTGTGIHDVVHALHISATVPTELRAHKTLKGEHRARWPRHVRPPNVT
jgi:DNA-binding CsgD family transcriptional regulator